MELNKEKAFISINNRYMKESGLMIKKMGKEF
jgi:hypothetical protein